MIQNGVDLVEGKPVAYLPFVASEYGITIFDKEINHFPATEAVILLCNVQGCFVVGEGNQRFNAVFVALVNDPVIKLQSLFIGHCLIASGIDPAPGNGKSKYLEIHFRKHADILCIAVVKIDPHQLQIIRCRCLGRGGENTPGQHILNRKPFSIFQISALALVGSHSPTP